MSAEDPSRKALLNNMFSKYAMAERRKDWEQFLEKLESYNEYSATDTIDEFVENLEKDTNQRLREIRTIVFKRNESRILEDGRFAEWCEKLANASLQIRSLMPVEDLKKYIRKTLNKRMSPIISRIERRYKSDLKEKLLIRRERKMNGLERDKRLNLEIKNEWQRLLKVVRLEDLVVYCLHVRTIYKEKQIQAKEANEDK